MLVDPWRLLNLDTFLFTWKRLKPSPTFSRLDFFLGVMSLVSQIEMIPSFKSDHNMVKMEIQMNKHVRGPGIGK